MSNPLYAWYELQERLKEIRAEELELRKQLFEQYFPDPDEGANKVEIEGQAELVGTLPYRYTLDEAALEDALKHVPKTKRDKLIKYTPKLSVSVYRKLSAKARDAFTAEAVTVTPGTPSLKIRSNEPDH